MGVIGVEDHLYRLARGGIRIEHDLRNFDALGLVIEDGVQDIGNDILVNDVVGRIEAEIIDAAVGKKFEVLPDDPGVGRIVIAIKRLAPGMETSVRGHGIVLAIKSGTPFLGGKKLIDIARPGIAAEIVVVLAEPDMVEEADMVLAIFERTHRQNLAPDLVDALELQLRELGVA